MTNNTKLQKLKVDDCTPKPCYGTDITEMIVLLNPAMVQI